MSLQRADFPGVIVRGDTLEVREDKLVCKRNVTRAVLNVKIHDEKVGFEAVCRRWIMGRWPRAEGGRCG